MNVIAICILCSVVMFACVFIFGKKAMLVWGLAVLIVLGFMLAVGPTRRDD